MATLRRLVSAVDDDVLSNADIRKIEVESVINLWAVSVTVTDTMRLAVGKIELMPAGTMNVSAAALGLVQVQEDQLIFNAIVGPGVGDLRLGVIALTTSLIFLLSVEPLL